MGGHVWVGVVIGVRAWVLFVGVWCLVCCQSVLSVLSVGGSESVSVGPGCAERERALRPADPHFNW